MTENSKPDGAGGCWLETLRRNVSSDDHGERIRTRDVGVTFEGRQYIVGQRSVGGALRLRRELDNPYDPKAVQVERLSGAQVGYLNWDLAARLAPVFNSGAGVFQAQVTGILGSRRLGHCLGAEIEFTKPGIQKGGDDIERPELDG